jgi:hypothetical protein
MNDAIRKMLERFPGTTYDDQRNALRELLQQIALLGLWRSKFFEHAAFYGGTALRVLHGLDRYSEDLDFSLLQPQATFSLEPYGDALARELSSFGFEVSFETRNRDRGSAIASAFLKADTLRKMIIIRPGTGLSHSPRPSEVLKIKLEVDTDPPGGFAVESRVVLLPVPFSVRVYALPDLFAGKMHAILCRKWKNRVKGRDWYDLVWYLGHHPRLHLAHLEARLRFTGNWTGSSPLTRAGLLDLLRGTINGLNVGQARQEAEPLVSDPTILALWSREFFLEIIDQIKTD